MNDKRGLPKVDYESPAGIFLYYDQGWEAVVQFRRGEIDSDYYYWRVLYANGKILNIA